MEEHLCICQWKHSSQLSKPGDVRKNGNILTHYFGLVGMGIFIIFIPMFHLRRYYRRMSKNPNIIHLLLYSSCISLKKLCHLNIHPSLYIITYTTRGIGFAEQNCVYFLTFEIVRVISRISEPIQGMFVLIWMYFLWWFQIMIMKFHKFDFFLQHLYFFDLSSALACRVEAFNNTKATELTVVDGPLLLFLSNQIDPLMPFINPTCIFISRTFSTISVICCQYVV